MRAGLFSTVAAAASLALGACASTGMAPEPVTPLTGAVVTDNDTVYSDALRCLSAGDTSGRPRIAVGEVADLSGRYDTLNGATATQGAGLMVMSALAKAGFPLAERYDTRVAALELEYANNRLIGADGEPTEDYRRVYTGSVAGSDYIVLGGITEINFNVKSGVAEARIGPVAGGHRYYVMTVAVDLRIVDATDLRVVNVVSRQKQIRGREIRAGIFEFIGDTTLDLGFGDRSQEPIHTAIRAIIEASVIELIAGFADEQFASCQSALEAHLAQGGPSQTSKKGDIS